MIHHPTRSMSSVQVWRVHATDDGKLRSMIATVFQGVGSREETRRVVDGRTASHWTLIWLVPQAVFDDGWDEDRTRDQATPLRGSDVFEGEGGGGNEGAPIAGGTGARTGKGRTGRDRVRHRLQISGGHPLDVGWIVAPGSRNRGSEKGESQE
jgi:hypothetical protein